MVRRWIPGRYRLRHYQVFSDNSSVLGDGHSASSSEGLCLNVETRIRRDEFQGHVLAVFWGVDGSVSYLCVDVFLEACVWRAEWE